MGMGKLNVWIRTTECSVVNRAGHLHVNDCHGNSILVTWFQNGHAQVEVPPGCYIVYAGVVYGNIYTDKTMVIVRCGDELCVNLVLSKFLATNPVPATNMVYVCPALLAMPLMKNGLEAGLKREELRAAINVIAKASKIEPEKMLEFVKAEVGLLEENMKQIPVKEQEEIKAYVGLVKRAF